MSLVSAVDAKLAREAARTPEELMTGQKLTADKAWTTAVVLPAGTELKAKIDLPGKATTSLEPGSLASDTLLPPNTTIPAGTIPPSSVALTTTPPGVKANVVNELIRWIPSESLLLYASLLALYEPLAPGPGQRISDLDFRTRWVGFGLIVAVTIVLVVVLTWGKARRDVHLTFKWPIFEATVGTVAFAAWSAALPDSPFLDWGWYTNEMGGYALLVVTTAIAVAAWALGKSPELERVVSA
jgi:hypothetical protein